MQNEIKPCPFCGSKPFVWRTNHRTYIECPNLTAESHRVMVSGKSDKEAIEAWNRRYGDGMNMFDFACRQLSELFDAPCNYSDIGDYMDERDEYFCSNCDKRNVWQCWKKYFELKYDDIYGK